MVYNKKMLEDGGRIVRLTKIVITKKNKYLYTGAFIKLMISCTERERTSHTHTRKFQKRM